jgi:membrane-bound lytic murein transglycosylase A
MSRTSVAVPAAAIGAELCCEWAKPMRTPLRGVVLFLPVAVTIIDAAEGIEARRYSPSAVSHTEAHSIAGSPSNDPPTVNQPRSFKIPNAALEPVNWGDLDGWTGDDHASAFATFYASCRPIVRASVLRAESAQVPPVRDRLFRPGLTPLGDVRRRPAHPPPPGSLPDSRPVRSALEEVCVHAVKAGRLDQEAARAFFEANFVPVRIRKLGDPAGFLTVYYEPIVDGSRFPTREFTVPLYRRPGDLVAPRVARGAPFPNTGRAFRQTPTGELVPYYDRGEIEDGALDGKHLEICWLRSAAEALSIQIEGSARVRLEDGTLLRISYDAHNGYPFVPVGRVLIERHLVPRDEASSLRIREWMHDNPEGATVVRRQNRQVVFFRIVGLNDDTEAIGAQGIPLTAGRSIAVDKALHAYGTPFFIEADLPLRGPRGQSPFRRLMIAQDTGSAIVGPARADLFFGAGEEAGKVSERIQQSGRLAILVPRELGLSMTGASVPLPPVKPRPSLAAYAFRPVVSAAKPEPSRTADRAPLRPAALHSAPPPFAKPEPSQVAARAFRPAATPPPAKQGLSHGIAPPPPAKTEPSQVTHALRPAAPQSIKLRPSPGSIRPRQPAANLAAPELRYPVRYDR